MATQRKERRFMERQLSGMNRSPIGSRAGQIDPGAADARGGAEYRRIEDWITVALDARSPLTAALDLRGGEVESTGTLLARRILTRSPRRGGGRWARLRIREGRGMTLAGLVDAAIVEAADVQAVACELGDLIETGHDRIVLDFSDVNRMSSRLLAVVAKAHRRCSDGGGLLKVCGLRAELAEAFAITRLDRSIPIWPDERAAIAGDWPEHSPLRPLPIAALLALRGDSGGSRPQPSPSVRSLRAPASTGNRIASGAAGIEEQVAGWLIGEEADGPVGPASQDHRPRGDVQPAGGVEGDVKERCLQCEVIQGIVVVTILTPVLDDEEVIAPIRRGLDHLFEQPLPLRVVVNLCCIATLSGRALGMLVAYLIKLARGGGEMRLCHVPPRVMAAIGPTGLLRLAATYPTIDEAVLTRWDARPSPVLARRQEA